MHGIAEAIGSVVYAIVYGPLKALGYSHPVHPIMVHLTIGTIFAAFLFDYMGLIFGRPRLLDAAQLNITLAFPAYILTALLGLADWSHTYQVVSLNSGGSPIAFAFGMKFILAGSLLLLFGAMAIVFPRTRQSSWPRHLLYLLAFLCTVGLGFFGGNVVYG